MANTLIREKKLHKARPITPCCQHPMAKFLKYVGRALSFALTFLKGEHFILNKCQDVPKELQKISMELQGKGELDYFITDIEGMYPAMPKEIIRIAIRDTLNKVRQQTSYERVMVPKYGKGPCVWNLKNNVCKEKFAVINFNTIIEALEFVLENTIIKTRTGELLKQEKGIPMGDSLSPGIAVGTTAWMEMEWMKSLNERTKEQFRAKRFMDDILMVTAKADHIWTRDKFIQDFKESTCYMPPLKLEDAGSETFLETRLALVQGSYFRYRLKNPNEGSEEQQLLWKYHHYSSFMPKRMKEGVMKGCFLKIFRMASDQENLEVSLCSKANEFMCLGYPSRMIDKIIWNLEHF